MKPLRGVLWACALGLVGVSPGAANAAWNNVFQVCCNSCGHGSPSVSAYAGSASCDPCPQQQCTTRYVQRCYYQPVTCYQSRSYYEPVTTYRTSYYYEPVTTYRYSCYYDPCTCSYQQTACPQTCYRLRSQCCPVQSWVQRCCQVPVTSYQRSFYWEPVTSCCQQPAQCCPTSNGGSCEQSPYGAPAASFAPAQPRVDEQRNVPGPGVQDSSDMNRYYPPQSTNPAPMPPASRAVPQRTTSPAPVAPRPPVVRLDRIVSAPVTGVQGQVVRRDNVPQAGARLMFVNASRQGQQQSVTADNAGRFRVGLASGDWLVYVYGADNRPVFHSKIDLRENETRPVTLVSR